jgi:fructose-1,6-bisphosphatase/inositol monophosphatase family enzyme
LTSGGRLDAGSGEFHFLWLLSCLVFTYKFCFYLRDVAAGIAILEEAGGLVTTANPPEDPANAPIEDTQLGSRLYLAIR